MNSVCWERLPCEILENIFQTVPSYQLPLNVIWVCTKWSSIILQPRFWINKLKINGKCIDENIWTVLQEFEKCEIIACLYYASVYQEYCTHQTPVPKKMLSIVQCESFENVYSPWCIDDRRDLIMASGIVLCRSFRAPSEYRYCALTLKKESTKGCIILLKLLEAKGAFIHLIDDYAFQNFSPRINYLQILKKGMDYGMLCSFGGCLPEGIPSNFDDSMEEICLAIGVDDQNNAIDPDFSKLHQSIRIKIHLKAGTNISNLPKLSTEYHRVDLFVSGLDVSHISWMADVIKNFVNEIFTLVLKKPQLDLKSWEKLLKSITEAGIILYRYVFLEHSNLDWESERILRGLFPHFSFSYCP